MAPGIKYFLFFLLTLALDWSWAAYISAVSDKKVVKAVIFSAFIYLTGVITTLFTIEDHWIILPALLGTIIGTYVSVEFSKKT
jgi:hypothetical protein